LEQVYNKDKHNFSIKEYLVLALMRHQLKYMMMCSLPSITYVETAPITASSAVMYSRNGISAIGAFITDGEEKYLLMSLKARCRSAPQVNLASFFNRSIGANALIFLDKLEINRFK
jgi:hypothetical protein